MKKLILLLSALTSIAFANAQQKPNANFTSDWSDFCVNSSANFTDQSTNNPTSWKWSFQGAMPSTSTIQNPQQIAYADSGVFDVTLIVSNTSGTDTLTVSRMITVHSAPPKPVLRQSGDTLYCSFDTSYVSYQWYDVGVQHIIGAIDSFYIPFFNASYNVWVTNRYGCRNYSDTITILNVSITEQSSRGIISLSPNPLLSSSILQVKASAEGLTEVVIYDMLGKEMMRKEFTGNRVEIEKGNLESGVYFVQVRDNEGQYIEKIVVE